MASPVTVYGTETTPAPVKSRWERLAPCVAEFVGTFLLVFVVGCCGICVPKVWGATAVGMAVMALMYTFRPVSGGHLNPCVSITLGLCGRCEWLQVWLFVCVQLLGGVLAGCVYGAIFQQTIIMAPKASYNGWQALIVEVLYSTMLCFVFISCTESRRNNPNEDPNQFFGLAVGLAVIAGGYAAGGVSGASFNPAVSLGIGVTSFDSFHGIGWGFLYTAFHTLGAFMAAVLMYVCRPEEYDERLVEQMIVPRMRSRLVGEFFGTFLLVFTFSLNVVMVSPATAWSAAAALSCLAYSLGNVSGGQFNPAVVLAEAMSPGRGMNLSRSLSYTFVQYVAGILAGLLVSHIHEVGPTHGTAIGVGPKGPYTWWAAASAELVFSFTLVLVHLALSPIVHTEHSFEFGLGVGACFTFGTFAIGSVSGGLLNPAVAWGVATEAAVSHGAHRAPHFEHCVWFSLFQYAGAVLAALAFRYTHPPGLKQQQHQQQPHMASLLGRFPSRVA